MVVQKIENMEEYKQVCLASADRLVVIDYSASWCGPCKFIHPLYEKLAEENPEVLFAEVDVDEAEEVAADARVAAMPTFHLIKGVKKVDELLGADIKKLTEMVAKYK